MGRHIAQVVDAVDQPIVVMAQDTVAAGDLVKADGAGWVRRVTEAFPLAGQNTAAGLTAAASNIVGAGYGWAGNPYAGAQRNLAALPDGGFALAYSGNGTTGTTGANVALHAAHAGPRQVVVLSAAASTGPVRVVRAGVDNVAVVWSENTDLRIAVVHGTTGAVVAASTSVGVVAVQAVHTWQLAPLANGEVVVAYPSSGGMAFKRYSASGVLQGAEVPVEANQAPQFMSILPLAAGGFVLRWAKTTATTGNRMARFNAAGVLQGAVVQVSSGTSAYDGAGSTSHVGALEGKLIELSNGNIVSTHIYDALGQGFKVYDVGLNLLNTVNFPAPSAQIQDVMQLAPKHGGGFWLVGSSGAGYRLQEYSNVGQLLREAVISSPGGYIFRIFDRPGNGPVTTIQQHSPSTPSASMQAHAFLPNLVAEGSATFVYNLPGTEMSTVWSEMLVTGLLGVAYVPYSNGVQNYGLWYAGAASVLGVAQNAATVGQPVRVATAGKQAINQAITAPPFDRRASSPVGTKGFTMGNVAVLNGINGG